MIEAMVLGQISLLTWRLHCIPMVMFGQPSSGIAGDARLFGSLVLGHLVRIQITRPFDAPLLDCVRDVTALVMRCRTLLDCAPGRRREIVE